MKHYLSPNNELFAYEADGSQDALIPKDFVAITNEEADLHRAEQARIYREQMSYVEKRAQEYPNFRDYLDGIVKGDQAQIDAYISACLAVKAKYPKPTGEPGKE